MLEVVSSLAYVFHWQAFALLRKPKGVASMDHACKYGHGLGPNMMGHLV
jgi:hypothetical protein